MSKNSETLDLLDDICRKHWEQWEDADIRADLYGYQETLRIMCGEFEEYLPTLASGRAREAIEAYIEFRRLLGVIATMIEDQPRERALRRLRCGVGTDADLATLDAADGNGRSA